MYDIVIIGAGVSGVFTALGLLGSGKKVLVIEKGRPLPERLQSDKPDAAFMGFGGLGISEGKYNFTNDFGGELAEKIGEQQAQGYATKVEQLLNGYGAEKVETYITGHVDWQERAEKLGFSVLTTMTKHLGRETSIAVFAAFFQALQAEFDFSFDTEVAMLQKEMSSFSLTLASQDVIQAKQIVVATGRSGNTWLQEIAANWELEFAPARLDLGLRVEMPGDQLDQLLQGAKEIKLRYGETFTYCMNRHGNVIRKRQEGLVMPDGQNYREAGASTNLNFTLFYPKYFPTATAANAYLQKVVGGINQGEERIVAGRLTELDDHFQANNLEVEPTLEADFSDLTAEIPAEYVTATTDFLKQLETLLDRPINGDTVVYGMDSKLYTPKLETNAVFETTITDLYLIGDCSGITSSLSQAAASGLYLADQLR